ncbi:MAG: DUF3800 domain-containing protein [Microbacteriaceae bacterium]|nr:DUF3800 domain-containing protein [Microbacteriaceae bacterium]
MQICYIDESGGGEPPDQSPSATPVMVIAGVIVDADVIPALTRAFVGLKVRHFGTRMANARSLDQMLIEVKGTQLLGLLRSPSRNLRRQAIRFLREVVHLLEEFDVHLLARIWVKAVGRSLDVRKRYGYTLQDFAAAFERHLAIRGESGILIADSRESRLNTQVAHSVFTQKWKAAGDPYPHIREVPLFASSDNHAGLQLADHVATGLLFAMSTARYADERSGNPHRPSAYQSVHDELAVRVRDRIIKIQVTDQIGQRRSDHLFN